MKLLLCPVCHDIHAMCHEKRACACGLSWGNYDEDGLHATVGGEGLVIGILNLSLRLAIASHNETPTDQHTLPCWLFTEPHRNITYP